jgi:hypothetical protein
MRGAIPSLPQYVFMAWCSVKNSTGTNLPLLLLLLLLYKILVGKLERMRPLRRPRRRWEDNIRIDFTEVGWEGGNWFQVAQDRDQWRALVNTVINLRVA